MMGRALIAFGLVVLLAGFILLANAQIFMQEAIMHGIDALDVTAHDLSMLQNPELWASQAFGTARAMQAAGSACLIFCPLFLGLGYLLRLRTRSQQGIRLR